MMQYAVTFFLIAVLAAICGFGGLAAGAAGFAKALFFVSILVALLSYLAHARTAPR